MRFIKPMRMMFLLLALAALGCSPAQAESITEDVVKDYALSMETYVLDWDVESLMAMIAPDAVLNMSVATPQGPQSTRISVEDYKANLVAARQMAEDYQFKKIKENITISPDGSEAVLDQVVKEKLTVQGQTVYMTSHQVTTLRYVDGQLLAVQIDMQSM